MGTTKKVRIYKNCCPGTLQMDECMDGAYFYGRGRFVVGPRSLLKCSNRRFSSLVSHYNHFKSAPDTASALNLPHECQSPLPFLLPPFPSTTVIFCATVQCIFGCIVRHARDRKKLIKIWCMQPLKLQQQQCTVKQKIACHMCCVCLIHF